MGCNRPSGKRQKGKERNETKLLSISLKVNKATKRVRLPLFGSYITKDENKIILFSTTLQLQFSVPPFYLIFAGTKVDSMREIKGNRNKCGSKPIKYIKEETERNRIGRDRTLKFPSLYACVL